MQPSVSGPHGFRRLSRVALALGAALGLAGLALWHRPSAARPHGPEGARSGPELSRDSAVASRVPARPRIALAAASLEAIEAELSAALGARVLALTRAYEDRRAADDPVGADVERLRFLELLNDETAPLFVRSLPRDHLETFFGDLALRHWAERDRAAAAAWMAAHPVAHPVPASALAHEWVTRDAEGLRAYLDALPSGEWKHLVAKSAAEEALVAARPREALALLDKIAGEDARRDELREWAATRWAQSNTTEAAEWAQGLAAARPELGERLYSAVAIGHAHKDPEAAAEWLLIATRDQATQVKAVEAIARIWTSRDPEAAARWASALPAGPLRESAEAGLLAVASPMLGGP